MKGSLVILCLCVFAFLGYGQNTDEWMNQENTQRKYLLRQIAATRTYARLLQKGYNTVRDGLKLVADVKSGDFAIHSTYFSSLKKVNPSLLKYAKIAEIYLYQSWIIGEYNSCLSVLKRSSSFSLKESSYVKDVFANLIAESRKDIGSLSLLIKSGELNLKDDERVSRIDALHAEVLDKAIFAQHFTRELRALSVHRMKQSVEANKSAEMNGIKLN